MTYTDADAADADHLLYVDADGVPRARTLITVLGSGTAQHRTAIRAVVRQIEAAGRRPVVCASQADRDFMVNGTLALELLPGRADLSVLSAGEYATYLRRRWETVLAKWQITEEITLGQDFETFLAGELAACPQQG